MFETLFRLFSVFPKQNKIVASCFSGKLYSDNAKPIAEAVHKQYPEADIVWMKHTGYQFSVGEGIRTVEWGGHFSNFRKIYEYATAKVWIDTHFIDYFFIKRKDQLFIETWHGGLGIKKIAKDAKDEAISSFDKLRIERLIKTADLMITNCDHLTSVYRNAFQYKGPVWKCGYPKNDILLQSDGTVEKQKVKTALSIDEDSKILVYAPTFRTFSRENAYIQEVCSIDWNNLRKALSKRFGGTWTLIIRYHPLMMRENFLSSSLEGIVDGTNYPSITELILAADAFISDYSSCIFDAALRDIPCFIIAKDYELYKEKQGIYYQLEDLPFPYAVSDQELIEKVLNYDCANWQAQWKLFKQRTGFVETGHATDDIAKVIVSYLKGNKKPLLQVINGQDGRVNFP